MIDRSKQQDAERLAAEVTVFASGLAHLIERQGWPERTDADAYDRMIEAYLQSSPSVNADTYSVADAAAMICKPVLMDAQTKSRLRQKLEDAITAYATISEEDFAAGEADWRNDLEREHAA